MYHQSSLGSLLQTPDCVLHPNEPTTSMPFPRPRSIISAVCFLTIHFLVPIISSSTSVSGRSREILLSSTRTSKVKMLYASSFRHCPPRRVKLRLCMGPIRPTGESRWVGRRRPVVTTHMKRRAFQSSGRLRQCRAPRRRHVYVGTSCNGSQIIAWKYHGIFTCCVAKYPLRGTWKIAS